MSGHPIENIMQTTMESIRNMVDVNTIVGDTVVMGDGTVIIPISKVSFGFVAGGGEYAGAQKPPQKDGGGQQGGGAYPFAGGAGAGVSICPMAFLVVTEGEINLMPVQFNNGYERVIERIPELVCQLRDVFRKDDEQEQEQGCGRGRHHHHHFGRSDNADNAGNAAPQDANTRPPKDEL